MEESIDKKPASLKDFKKEKVNFSSWLRKHAPFLFDWQSTFYFGVFLFALAVLWSINLLFENSGTSMMGWDYSWQYVPFAYDFWDQWHVFFSTGRFPLYDATIWLGLDNIGSNSYYSLFDPFLAVMALFPRQCIPWLFSVATFLKLMVSGLLMRWYLKYHGISEAASRIGATALAFSGYMMFMVGFPTTVSACVYIPLILLGIDKIIREKKPYCLVIGLFLLGITSFFFLVVSCIWGVCYAMWRYFWTVKSRNAKDNVLVILMGVASFALGLMMCAWTILPSIRQSALSGRSESIGSAYFSSILSSLKSHDLKSFFMLIFEPVGDHPYRELMGLVSFFFPSGGYLYLPLIHTGYDAWTASIFCYTPFIICFFTGIILSIKQRKWNHLIAILLCVFLVFTNFSYFFFYAFSGNGYGRWFLMLVPEIILYGCWAFDEARKEAMPIRFLGAALSLICTLGAYFLINAVIKEGVTYPNPNELTYWLSDFVAPGNVSKGQNALWYVFAQVGYILAEGIIFIVFNAKKWMPQAMLGLLSVEIIVAGNAASASYYSIYKYETRFMGGTSAFETAQKVASAIQEDGMPFSRTYMDQVVGSSNEVKSYMTVLGLNSASAFHSLMNFDTEDFALMNNMKSPGGTRTTYGNTKVYNPNWSGYYGNKRFATDSVLGYHYYAIKNDYSGWVDFMPANVPFGAEEIYSLPVAGKENKTRYKVYKLGEDSSPSFGYAVDNDKLYKIGKKEGSYYLNSFYPNQTGQAGFRNLIRVEDTLLNGAIFEDDAELPDGMSYSAVPDASYDSSVLANFGKKALRFGNGLKGYTITVPEDNGLFPKTGLTGSPNDAAYFFDPSYERKSLGSSSTAIPDRTHVVFESSTGDYLSSDETGCYIEFKYWNIGPAPRVLVFGDKDGKTNQLLTFESSSLSLAKDAGYYNQRSSSFGLYVEGHAKSVVLLWSSGATAINIYPQNLTMYVTGKKDMLRQQQKLVENSLKDVKKENANEYSFSSDYSSDRIVVTELGFDKGWSLKATKEDGTVVDCPVYKLDGGLVGFCAPQGKTTYILSYKTPYLTGGTVLACLGTACLGGFGIYSFIRNTKKRKDKNPSAA